MNAKATGELVVVIVGAGLAGGNAAVTLREEGWQAASCSWTRSQAFLEEMRIMHSSKGLTLSLLIDSCAMDTHCFTQEQLWQKCRIGHKFSRKVLAFHRDVSHTVPSTSLK